MDEYDPEMWLFGLIVFIGTVAGNIVYNYFRNR